MSYVLPSGKSLCMLTLSQDYRDSGGLVWPESGSHAAPTWIPTQLHNNGLFGLLWGEGSSNALFWGSAVYHWVIVEVTTNNIIDIGRLAKFPSCTIVYIGAQSGATAFISAYAPAGTKVIGALLSAGIGGTAIVGDYGTATAGNNGTAVAGNRGSATAGNGGTATAGEYGTATAGDGGTATVGNSGTALAGNSGTAVAGDGGTATAGDNGSAATGFFGVASAGVGGKAKAKSGGAIRIQFFNGTSYEWKTAATGGVGQLNPDTFYKLNGAGAFILA